MYYEFLMMLNVLFVFGNDFCVNVFTRRAYRNSVSFVFSIVMYCCLFVVVFMYIYVL